MNDMVSIQLVIASVLFLVLFCNPRIYFEKDPILLSKKSTRECSWVFCFSVKWSIGLF